jgi:hypothetical protein
MENENKLPLIEVFVAMPINEVGKLTADVDFKRLCEIYKISDVTLNVNENGYTIKSKSEKTDN